MGKVVLEVPVPELVCDEVQKVYYEYLGLKSLLNSVVTKESEPRYNIEIYERLLRDYQEKFMEFNLYMSSVREVYAKEFNTPEYKETLLFEDRVLRIESACGGSCSI